MVPHRRDAARAGARQIKETPGTVKIPGVTLWVLSRPLQRLSQARRSACPVRSHVQRTLEPLAKSHRALSSIRISLAANAASSFLSHQPSPVSAESGEVPSSATPFLAEGASKPVPSPALVRLGTVPLLGFQRIASPPTWPPAVLSHPSPKR